MSSISEALRPIATDPPTIDVTVVANAVKEQFGIVGKYAALVSERDQNFKLTTATGERYVVKIVGAAEEIVVTDFQIAALLHLEEKEIRGVPRIVRTKSNQYRGEILSDDGSVCRLRLVSWLSGDVLIAREMSEALATQIGHRLGDLDRALQDFTHEGDCQVLLWDTQRAGDLRELGMHIDDPQIRRRVSLVLEEFSERTLPALPQLPRQIIHNDFNPENILLSDAGDVVGIIDFSDMLRAPRVVDLSTAASYLRGEKPLQHILPMVAAYCERVALRDEELDQLFDLIRTRLAMTLTVLYWRLSTRRQGDPYREKTLASHRGAYDFLAALDALGREAVIEQFKKR